MKIQVTLYSDKGYRPISCLISVTDKADFIARKKEVQQQGIVKICQKRYWQKYHLTQYGYTRVKMREYPEGA